MPVSTLPMRMIYLFAGWCAVGLGFVGIFMPMMPTTPFLLLALWCFARSSKRFHDWLYFHPRLGNHLRDWRDHRVVPPRAKACAVGSMAVSWCLLAFVFQAPFWVIAHVGAILAVVSAYLITRPSRAPGKAP
jgi:uncharacterized membrane protein YbaN (DUF454 family)